MKIAISSEGKTIDSMIDARFGRCKYFIIASIQDNNITGFESVENQGANQSHGAGPKSAQQIGELGVDAIITGNVEPNTTDILEQLGIKAYHAKGKVGEAIDNFDKLEEIKAPGEKHPTQVIQKAVEEETDGKKEEIFFPVLDNNATDSEISSHFGHAPFFGLYNTKTKEFSITENTLDHVDPNKSPVDQIVEAVAPTTVYAQGIGERAIKLFNERGIKLKTGPYNIVKDAIENLDKLEELNSGCGHIHEHHH